MKHVLVFGAGLVAKPLVQYLLDQAGFQVTVASRTLSKAEALVGDHPRGKAVAFDIEQDGESLSDLVAQADLAVSLLPYIYHVQVAEQCIHHHKHMVTTSYVGDAMRALDDAAQEAGVILLNEIGLDPGIDHMSAKRIINHVHETGGKVKSFCSYCGGLPAPDANDNPLGYKFSWSPRGVVLAGRNDARYLEHGHIVEVPNRRLFATHFLTWVEGLGDFEAYPNRNSFPYIDLYGIPETDTMYRGTLRNLGWCDVMQKLNELGYFSLDEQPDLPGKTFRQVMAGLIGKDDTPGLKADLADFLNIAPNSGVMMTLEWLGLLSDAPVSDKATLLDVLADQMLPKMIYREGERDMVILVHEFVAAYPDRREFITSTLIDFGIPGGDTSMSRTVGSPAAIGVHLILDGEITLTGVHIPVLPEIYEPVLGGLEQLGITCEEKVDVKHKRET
ncbi:MAG: saccharopine dehydrogenase C-terminal domain-containing protein [Chloroflexota bacterium]|nr:saccharopine dehydrogenase C-terminal domain-containing protein [Chloroflexota bacterium]